MSESILKIAIADSSPIIRSGLSVLLKRIQGYHIHTFEAHSSESLLNSLRTQKPDLVIVNPTYWGVFDLEKIKSDYDIEACRFFAFVTGMIDERISTQYDNTLNIYDDQDSIKAKLDEIFDTTETETEDSQTLSPREKDIIIGVVKGLTNKEIATSLFLSTHTVITHRRNIARKLEIHSTAGLTIYAIVNKLVELNDIKQK